MIENRILKKEIFSAKMWSAEALFPPLVKAKNQHKNLEKTPETKKMRNKTFKCSKFFFLQKNKVNIVKIVDHLIHVEIGYFLAVFLRISPC